MENSIFSKCVKFTFWRLLQIWRADLAFIHHVSRSFDCRFVEYQMFTDTELHLVYACVCAAFFRTRKVHVATRKEIRQTKSIRRRNSLQFIESMYCWYFLIALAATWIHTFFLSWKLSATGAVATILFSNTHTHTYHYCVYLLPLYLLFTRTLDVFFAFNFALSLSRSLILCVSQSHAGRLHCSNRNNAFVYICKFRAMHVLYVQPTYMAIALWTIADMHLYVCRWNCTRLFIVQSPIAKHLFRKLHKRRKKNRINRTLCVESEWVSEWVFVYVTVCARSWEYVEFKIYV